MKKTIILIHEVYGITVSLLMIQDDLIKKQFNVLLPSLYEDNFCGKNEKEFYNKFCHDTVIEKGVKNIDCFIKLETSRQ